MYNAVGIDASKLKSTITIIQPAGVVIRKPFDVLHTSDELNTLVTYLKSFLLRFLPASLLQLQRQLQRLDLPLRPLIPLRLQLPSAL